MDEPDVVGTKSPAHFSPASTAVVVGDELVMSDIRRLADALDALLSGLMYALHLEDPREHIPTFTFIHKVLMAKLQLYVRMCPGLYVHTILHFKEFVQQLVDLNPAIM